MARGFLSGAFWGGLLAMGGAGALSVLSDGPEAPLRKPDTAAVEVPAGSEFNQSRNDDAANLPASEPVVAGTTAPQVVAPEPDDLSPLKGADTEPGVQPSPGRLETGLSEPVAGQGAAPDVATRSDGPVGQSARSSAPQAPQDEADLSISTEPAQPMAPEVAPEETAFTESEPTPEPTPEPEPEPEPQPEPEPEPQPAPEVQSDAPDEPTAPTLGTAQSDGQPPAGDAQPVENTLVPAKPEASSQELVIRVAPEPATPAKAGQDSGESAKREGAEAAREIEPVEETGEPGEESASIRIGKPAGDISTLGTQGVRTGRLPSLRAGSEAGAKSADAGEDRSTFPPIKRFAVEFQANENKPKMAIVLIDDGSGPVAMDKLSAFPYPLAFAVDTGRADATEKMAIYRGAGFEVLALVDLPEGSSPADVEVAMPVLLARVPEAVAVLEAPQDGIQSDRQISDQAVRILAETGHGLLLYPKGLNTAQKLAAKNGVPSATIFRDFDSSGQKPRAIRRFLDNGALRARSEGGVVMIGRVRPDTVNALLLWGLQDRAEQIALVPVSQLLQPQD